MLGYLNFRFSANTSKPKLAPTLYSAYFLKILVAMCPPKPKVLLIA
uniref:Uncharacterized protein n=1 Tax=Proteus genomosp. 6 TaxID=1311820 RepID=A0A6G8F178_9GAMM|nr:hypothetical protein [Proteus genomosp. 6]